MAQRPATIDGDLIVSSSLSEAWDNAPIDPDPNTDLDYEIKPLTIIKTGDDNGDHYMILPGEDNHLTDDEFMVADPGSICLLDECR